ncbi:unnamed protein product [Larinioides sclopetarius]|uniref:Uncharacterized protein n=1 Tax=Larinioides sclopetarius TaxID=280406 RepID=A0AAV2BWV0_9ARAC
MSGRFVVTAGQYMTSCKKIETWRLEGVYSFHSAKNFTYT